MWQTVHFDNIGHTMLKDVTMQRRRVLQAIFASASATIFPVPASAQCAFDVAGKPLQGGHRLPACGERPFEVRNIAANGAVWTGQGEQVVARFPALASLPPEDQPTENGCSTALRPRACVVQAWHLAHPRHAANGAHG